MSFEDGIWEQNRIGRLTAPINGKGNSVRAYLRFVGKVLIAAALTAAALWLAARLSLVHTTAISDGARGGGMLGVERWHLEWRFDYHIIQGSDDYRSYS